MADLAYVVNAGLALLTAAIKAATAEPKYVGWGTGAGAAAKDSSGLGTADGDRVSATTTTEKTTVANDTYQAVATITAGGTRAITEVAMYTASTGGTCFLHGSFSAINLSAGDSIEFTIKAALSQA